jgi:hypothetical protein
MGPKLLHLALAAVIACPIPFAAASVSPDVLRRTQGTEGAQTSDWPCIQRKVPELSVAAVWSGPPVDAALEGWRNEPEVAEAARRIASRRLPLDEATAEVQSYANDLEAEAKSEKLTMLFAGIFQILNAERSEVMEGIERYARKQKLIAEEIRQDQERLSQLQMADPGSAEAAALDEQLLVEVRIFNDRRTSLSYVCEVPTLIEQRIFELARAIQGEIPN